MAMNQTVLSMVIEVQPQSAALLRGHVSDFRAAEEATTPKYVRLREAIPSLHFMSMTVSDDAAYDPVFVLEANFDGPPRPFWALLEAAIGPRLRDMFRCAKPPGDGAADLFAAVTADGSTAPIAPLLAACTITPAVFHQGNRGLDRPRIDAEAALFLAARPLADAPTLRALTPAAIHADLRASLLPQFPWLNATPPPRIGMLENLGDLGRLAGFIVVALAVLLAPGVVLGLACKSVWLPTMLALAAISFGLHLRDLNGPSQRWSLASGAAGALALLTLAAILWSATPWGSALRSTIAADHPVVFWALVAVLGPAAVATWVLVWLRLLERSDPSQDDPPMDEAALLRIARSEDQTVQNHMISIVHIKPGVLRAVLVRAGLWGLGLLLRVIAHDGYLGSMRTIHFAHWAIVSNGGRLMFHSNFDSSWESYLDDFIEKAHGGLTLAWTGGVGFPATRFLVQDGATHGRQFKAWARHSMTESLFWFSAYPSLTVNQIERQARLAQGLRQATMTEPEAQAWLLDL